MKSIAAHRRRPKTPLNRPQAFQCPDTINVSYLTLKRLLGAKSFVYIAFNYIYMKGSLIS